VPEPSKLIRIQRKVAYFAKKTTSRYKKGRQVSLAYAKRYPKLVKKAQFLFVEQRRVIYDPILQRQTYGAWHKTAQEKLTHYEHILDLASLSDRRISSAFSRYRIYSKIWENNRGIIRISINGHVKGRRVKEVIHIGYMKRLWSEKHNGYQKFKAYLLNKVLQALRRRGLRLSNPHESRERLVSLKRQLAIESQNLAKVPEWLQKDQAKKVEGIARLIRAQKDSKQVQGGTIKIEKLINMS